MLASCTLSFIAPAAGNLSHKNLSLFPVRKRLSRRERETERETPGTRRHEGGNDVTV